MSGADTEVEAAASDLVDGSAQFGNLTVVDIDGYGELPERVLVVVAELADSHPEVAERLAERALRQYEAAPVTMAARAEGRFVVERKPPAALTSTPARRLPRTREIRPGLVERFSAWAGVWFRARRRWRPAQDATRAPGEPPLDVGDRRWSWEKIGPEPPAPPPPPPPPGPGSGGPVAPPAGAWPPPPPAE